MRHTLAYMRLTAALTAALTAVLFAGCGSTPPCNAQTGACLSLYVSSGVKDIDTLHIGLVASAASFVYDFTDALSKGALPADEAVLLPATLGQAELTITITGDSNSVAVAKGGKLLTLSGGHDTAHVSLASFSGSGCIDGAVDGTETDTDCGGSACPACAIGLSCALPSDCASKVCTNNVCQKPLCANGVLDPGEGDVDCGGTCPTACADGKTCTKASDCVSGACGGGTCLQSAGATCTMSSQCATQACGDGKCVAKILLSLASPAKVPSNRTTPVALTGANFVAGSQLAAAMNGQSVPVSFVSSTQLILTTPIALGQHGPAPITITNGDGSTMSVGTVLSYYLGVPTFSGGDGIFMQPATGTSYRVLTAVIADLDGDGAPDLVTGQAIVALHSNAWVSNVHPNESGSFVDNTLAGIKGLVEAAADFDGDHKVDLLVDQLPGAEILFGNGSFNFDSSRLEALPQPAATCSTFVADFDGDTNLDVFFACANAAGSVVLNSYGNGPSNAQSVATMSRMAAVGDVSGDGTPDIVTIEGNALRVFVNNGDATFKAAVSYMLSTTPVVAPTLIDYDKDGALDVVVTLGATAALYQNLNDGNGTLGLKQMPTLPSSSVVIGAGDIDGNGKNDLVVNGAGGAFVMPGNGDGTFAAPIQTSSIGEQTRAPAFYPAYLPALIGDFDGDGRVDIGAGAGIGFTTVLAPLAPGGLATQVDNALIQANTLYNVAADFDGDGREDFAFVADEMLFVYLSRAGRTFKNIGAVTLSYAPEQLTTADFDGDKKSDLMFAASNQLWFMHGNGDGTFAPAVSAVAVPETFHYFVMGDFNGDGKPDVAAEPQTASEGFAVYLNTSGASLTFAPGVSTSGVSTCAPGNFVGLGHVDIVCVGSDSTELYAGNGDGTFEAPTQGPLGNFVGVNGLAVGDFDGDGIDDYAVVTEVVLNKGDGVFVGMQTPYAYGGGPTVDVDRDGRLEAQYSPSSSCAIALSSPEVRPEGIELPSATCQSGNRVFGDFDGDGLPDFVNVGANGVWVFWNRSY